MLKSCFFFLLFSFVFLPTFSQPLDDPLQVFLDCESCDTRYLKQRLGWVTFVRDRKVADIHLFIADQPMASGGRQYDLRFIGVSDKYAREQTIPLQIGPFNSQIEINERLEHSIKLGLLSYLVTYQPLTVEANIASAKNSTSTPTSDPWDYWIFEVSGAIDWSQESNRKEYEWQGELDIDRITKAWRIRSEFETESQINQVQRDSSTLRTRRRRSEAEASVVKSLNQHWSAGVFANLYASTYVNIRTGSRVQAALEYNVFPYQLSATRELTIAYMIGPRYFSYLEQTIYDEMQEQRFGQGLRINLDVKRPWGRAEVQLEGSHFMHDLSKNRLEIEAELSLQIVKGLFLQMGAEASLIHDQLYLPKGSASLEEILLEQRALATNFELEFRVGIGYTFGSIYNSVVNTRL